MHALKWYDGTAMVFSPDDGGTAAPAAGGGEGGSSVAAPPAPAPDGGGSAPSSTPAEGAPDWSNLGSADDLDYVEIPAEPTAPPTEQVKEPPVAPAQPAPVQEPTPIPAAQPQPPASEADRPLTAADPWRIAEGLEANRNEVIAHLAGSKFALSEDDVKDLDTDVTVAVPKLLSRVFLESQMAMQKFIAQAVPAMVKQYNTVTSANETAEKQFFKAHPALDANNPQHRATAVRIATVYRQANPNIPLQQLIQEVGPMVMASLQVSQAAAPATRQQPTPAKPVPFRPAVNGGGGAPTTTEPANEWAGLGQNYD